MWGVEIANNGIVSMIYNRKNYNTKIILIYDMKENDFITAK
jgi:hypothetical protein